jgi:hypothetical protein
MDDRDNVAVAVGPYVFAMGACPGADHVLHRAFETGRTRCQEEILEEG